jgi:hypothetical protein
LENQQLFTAEDAEEDRFAADFADGREIWVRDRDEHKIKRSGKNLLTLSEDLIPEQAKN